MKLMLKPFLVVCLFSSVAFADGDMGNGGKTCPPNTQNCFTSNEQPEPATEPTSTDRIKSKSDDYVLNSIQEYLISIFEEARSFVNF